MVVLGWPQYKNEQFCRNAIPVTLLEGSHLFCGNTLPLLDAINAEPKKHYSKMTENFSNLSSTKHSEEGGGVGKVEKTGSFPLLSPNYTFT